ncbi:MAG: hypothetical protein EXS10_07170 [Phycisphaerales bacterium]|nr:hypothetical protein [Phycisphaerales bacterium]
MLGLSTKQPPDITGSRDHISDLGIETAAALGSAVLVAGIRDEKDDFSARWIAALCGMLGGAAEEHDVTPRVSTHLAEVQRAEQLLVQTGYGIDVIRRNTGLILPFSCRPPASGSGTSRALPGTLMLPTGVPRPLYAECWLHECLHMELLLGEWLSGGELALSATPLPTPWRTVNRPANLLLHGCFVFVHVAQFMYRAQADYASMPKPWELSAARGRRICACEVETAASFRTAQVRVAMETLTSSATLTELGQRVFESVEVGLSALDSQHRG